MKVFTCEAGGVYLGYYAVIVAEDAAHATELLRLDLERQGLLDEQSLHSIHVKELNLEHPALYVLTNGDY